MYRRKTGAEAETIATDFLQNRGYSVLERNVRTKFGEIDIIARQGNTLVFVEVRSSSFGDFHYPLESIGPQKIRRITRAVARFLQMNHKLRSLHIRFDCIAVTWCDDIPKVVWVQNAFEPAKI